MPDKETKNKTQLNMLPIHFRVDRKKSAAGMQSTMSEDLHRVNASMIQGTVLLRPVNHVFAWSVIALSATLVLAAAYSLVTLPRDICPDPGQTPWHDHYQSPGRFNHLPVSAGPVSGDASLSATRLNAGSARAAAGSDQPTRSAAGGRNPSRTWKTRPDQYTSNDLECRTAG